MSDPTDTAGPADAFEGPGNLIPSLAVSAVFAVISLVLWGFPGVWLAVVLLPGFIIGSTGAHIVRALKKVHAVRPGVVALGIFLGGVSAFAALALSRAATDSVDQRIERKVTIEAPIELVWDRVKLADQRVAWSILVNEAEAIGKGRGETVGTRYRVTLNIDGATMTGEHEIVAYEAGRRVGWKVHFPAAVRVQEFTEQVVLSEQAGNTLVTYTISYRVPSVLGRLFNNLRVRSMFEEAARISLAALLKKATE